MTMKNSIKALAAQHKQIQAKKAALYEKAVKLEADLNAAFGHGQIYAIGENTPLELEAPGEGTYGHLYYDGEELRVHFRHTDEDLHDDSLGITEDEHGYRSRALSDIDPKWLDRLFAPEQLESLFANLGAELNRREGQVDRSLAVADSILTTESAELAAQMSATLASIGNEVLTKNWGDVVDGTHLETADGLTRSSRMLESVCAWILSQRGIELPDKKTMPTLIKACLDALAWPEPGEAALDVRQLTGGVQSIANAVGTLRTHFGTAHGSSSHLPPLDPAFAILAKNACATVAIFLIDRHKHGGQAPAGEVVA
ncbi:abortive infection family protein [Burkholderia sp. Ac-20344]|uniref:abortive infection family protein n=1 Tax=Burkholderia sp. Ac-20344 TaxID=2703890 RepID=UPI00197B1CB9|nr:abortive infection family protein [Burkholderia sp. Ac-20344]MBN3831918.1 abortive infection family protein [Burkholderia sp. Ac-20344]